MSAQSVAGLDGRRRQRVSQGVEVDEVLAMSLFRLNARGWVYVDLS